MKAVIASVLFALSATAVAQAADLRCTTDVNHNPRTDAETIVTIGAEGDSTTATVQTFGHMAHFVTAPRTFAVSVAHEGPEVAIFSNSEEGFELEVNYQSFGGQGPRGNLTREIGGEPIKTPVACNVTTL